MRADAGSPPPRRTDIVVVTCKVKMRYGEVAGGLGGTGVGLKQTPPRLQARLIQAERTIQVALGTAGAVEIAKTLLRHGEVAGGVGGTGVGLKQTPPRLQARPGTWLRARSRSPFAAACAVEIAQTLLRDREVAGGLRPNSGWRQTNASASPGSSWYMVRARSRSPSPPPCAVEIAQFVLRDREVAGGLEPNSGWRQTNAQACPAGTPWYMAEGAIEVAFAAASAVEIAQFGLRDREVAGGLGGTGVGLE